MKSMDAREFVTQLTGQTEAVDDAFVLGMAKPADRGYDSFLLGPTHRCGPWTEVQVASVARVVPVATGSCGAHKHPIVAVYFNEREDPTAGALARMLRTAQTELFAELAVKSGTLIAQTHGQGQGSDGEATICWIVPFLGCWERDWTQDFPPGTPPPAAQPAPTYICGFMPLRICLPPSV